MRAIIAKSGPAAGGGVRDLALIVFLYNTGARVAEALAVKVEDLSLRRPRQVRLHGKGGKDRMCPLWPETARTLGALLDQQGPGSTNGVVFRSARGGPLTRDGVAYLLTKYFRRAARDVSSLRDRRVTPHVLRHSCAVALLQAGVDLSVIRDYLGHASVATTGRYLASNMDMKRKVLESFWERAGLTNTRTRPWRPSKGTLEFLGSL